MKLVYVIWCTISFTEKTVHVIFNFFTGLHQIIQMHKHEQNTQEISFEMCYAISFLTIFLFII